MAIEEKVGVLVVEDDALILLSAVDTVEAEGYKVYQASNADDAILLLENCSDIRIIFTDIEMPGSMDGMKLATYVRDRWPPVSIIITSGRVPASDVRLPAGGIFLPKPYAAQALTDRLRALA